MNIPPFDPSDRYRRRSAERMRRFLIAVCFLCFLSGLSFWLGQIFAHEDLSTLKREISRMELQHTEFEAALTQSSAEAQTAITRYKDLELAVSEVVSEGPMQDLLVVLKAQLDKGVHHERLLSVLKSTRPPENCSKPKKERFVVSTPHYKGARSAVGLANGVIQVYAKGASAVDGSGDPQAWYDPSKPVEVSFEVEGTVAKKSGALPVYHSIILEKKEYRISVEAGAQSFAQVRFDVCDFP